MSRTAGFLTGLLAPALLAGAAWAAASIQTLTSPGGKDYWLVEEASIPMVAMEISFVGGASTEPDGKLGASNFLAAMLDEGAGDMESLAFSTRAELLAANFSFSAGQDAFSVSARMLSENLDESAVLLRTAIAEPRFDEEPMRRVRGQIVSSLRSAETDPNALASRAWFGAAFPDHPYGRPGDGTIETVSALDADDLRAAHRRLLTREGAVIGIVGDVTPEKAGEMVDMLLAGLPEAAPERPAMVEPDPAGAVSVVDFDAPQTTVMFGHAGPLRDDPDFIPAYVMNYILGGGGFSSRLTVEVREKRGLAYSTYSYIASLDRAGLILGGVGTANARAAESLDVIRAEWRRMAEEGVTAEELDKARRYLTGAYPLRFDSNGKIAGILVAMQRDGLPADYVTTRNALVEAVTPEDVSRVARKWLDADALRVVAVGRPEGLGEAVEPAAIQ
ncbi:M16 family metallopeptidase [Rubrimonas cliftonensis]|uniref:M16 family metallopeptidase n=1 Tax=Rubrimonas cliftonensis TaxID=89524 RepID=UPI001FDF044E|nr:pitrilysin family protein [Rubrimonas cliftonensis]